MVAMRRTARALPCLFILALTVFTALLPSACRTAGRQPSSAEAITAPNIGTQGGWQPRPPLKLTFAGDIMAHDVNYKMLDYNRIYDELRPLLIADDLTFGNFEIPVADSLPLSNYPLFNVHFPYARAAVDGGFDVFSLANNHSNDQGLIGIDGSLAAFRTLQTGHAMAGRLIRSSGLRGAAGESIRAQLIEVKGWRILFLAITELSNTHDGSLSRVYYTSPSTASRELFLDTLRGLRAETPCDFFILSVHLNEPEYLITVDSKKKTWFEQLASAGVDIVWAHHPHVMQEWKHQRLPESTDQLFMYSMGNFISGQRWNPQPETPDGYREYTGDAVLLGVECREDSADHSINFTVSPIPITNFRDPRHGMVVRFFDEAFISELSPYWEKYYRFRYQALAGYLPIGPMPLPPPVIGAIVEL